jgi:hypothetical protein
MSSVIHQTGKFGGQSDSKPLNNVPDTTQGKKDKEDQEPPRIKILEKND